MWEDSVFKRDNKMKNKKVKYKPLKITDRISIEIYYTTFLMGFRFREWGFFQLGLTLCEYDPMIYFAIKIFGSWKRIAIGVGYFNYEKFPLK